MKDTSKSLKELLDENARLSKRVSELESRLSLCEKDIFSERDILKKILEILPVGVWITDRNGKIIQGNQAGRNIWAGERLVGINRYGEYRGWWADTGKPIAPEEWAAARAIIKGETSLNERVEIECFDKTHKFILNSAVPIKNEKHGIIGAIIVNQDLTDIIKSEREQERLFAELKTAFEKVNVLSGLLPICASCKRVKDDHGHWKPVERFIEERSNAEFTHSLCPDCARKLYPDFFKKGHEKK
ncbi:MAG: PAS domain-containing protein [Deltaproteobacteria bacterium]|nr:PAS domain-containing protein [Deltaproteobacteria bacterium]